MKHRLIIRTEAEADIEESFNWYEDQVGGLGHEFRFALRATLRSNQANPLKYQVVHKRIRRALVRRFPHAFYFFVDDKTIVVSACVHHKRDPKEWKAR